MKKFMAFLAVLVLVLWYATALGTSRASPSKDAVAMDTAITGDSIGPPECDQFMIVASARLYTENPEIREVVMASPPRPDMAWAYSAINTGLKDEVYFKTGPITSSGVSSFTSAYTVNLWRACLSSVQLIIEKDAAQRGQTVFALTPVNRELYFTG